MEKQIRKVNVKPDYKRIYTDLILKRYPEKEEDCDVLLQKETLSLLDVIQLNQKIFNRDENSSFNQKLRAYDKDAIVKILIYQKKNRLSNVQLAAHFKISKNTIARWKKIFF
ncbi:helix-turn-helix domain-containing protein [Chryseobacterium sp. c4a]|uniref:helix-turn-helix domain-containing protein n=1 Tax=Chryseobacterium sp. c4a TaxID=1573582 RepID=UPI0013572E35|nr:helix-turn-helix domain-containing protein [Chryseobacterium sp. c4a]